jgi:hypothetical protein
MMERRDLVAAYLLAKAAIVDAGFEKEIAWQERRCVDDVDETMFLREASWVVLSSGMREVIVRKLFPAVDAAFGSWRTAAWIVEHAADCIAQAMQVFRHTRKLEALVEIARIVEARSIEQILADLRTVGPSALLMLPYMGPATSKHLAKNLGIDIVKPDRHLVRVAEATGYDSPASLCEYIARAVDDRVAVVDLVIWRFATISSDYTEHFGTPVRGC